MNAAPVTPRYESPLREAQKEDTRRRILDAAGALLHDGSLENLSYAAIACGAGVKERTVYRHFPNKDELLEALWGWLDPRIGLASFPSSEAEFAELPKQVFAAFDDNANLMRALWTSPQGREFRLKTNAQRQAAMRRSTADAVAGLPPKERAAITAAVQLLYSGAAWLTMKDYWGFTGREAGAASSLAIQMLLQGARVRAKSAHAQKHNGEKS